MNLEQSVVHQREQVKLGVKESTDILLSDSVLDAMANELRSKMIESRLATAREALDGTGFTVMPVRNKCDHGAYQDLGGTSWCCSCGALYHRATGTWNKPSQTSTEQ